MSIRKLLAIKLSLLLFSCASMKEVEEMSSKEVIHLWKYYQGGDSIKVDFKLEGKSPFEFKPPKFVNVKVGSYFDGKAIYPRKEALLLIEEEDYGTDF